MSAAKQLNNDKYTNAVLYFLTYCNNSYLGKTKLNKLLYYLDFVSYRDRRQSVSGEKYFHLDHGPVPDNIEDLLVELKKKRKIKVEITPYKELYKTRFEAVEQPDTSKFDSYEVELLAKICKTFELWSTDKIVSQTHLESPWLYSKPYDEVDYDYADDIDIIPAHASPDSR